MNTGGNRSFLKFIIAGIVVVFMLTAFRVLLSQLNKTALEDRSFLDIQKRMEMLPKLKIGEQSVRFQQGDDEIEVFIGNSLVGRYLWGDKKPKPILYDVKTLTGDRITRSLPFQDIKGETKDHPHHTGIFFTYASVNGKNFWANTGTPPQIKQISMETNTDSKEKGIISVVMHWVSTEGKVLLEERREMSFFSIGDGYVIDFSIDLAASGEKMVFADTKEGMFSIRISDWLREKGGCGRYYSSNGDQTEKDVWGKRAEWVCLEGRKGDKRVGVAVIHQPGSVNYPTYWHARGYGLFAANPLGQYEFEKTRGIRDAKRLDFVLEPGRSTHFGFRVYIYEAVSP